MKNEDITIQVAHRENLTFMSTSAPDTTYLFIDAGYLRRVIDDRLVPFIGRSLPIQWDRIRSRHKAARVFYYDSLDDARKPGETDSMFQNRVRDQQKFFDKVSSEPGYFLRLGAMSGESGRRRQKEVDVLLAVDMLMHSHNRNMGTAVLIAGDRDFKPVVEALVHQGTLVKVISDRRSGSKDLSRAADSSIALSLEELWFYVGGANLEDQKTIFPQNAGYMNLPKTDPTEIGQLDGKMVSMWNIDGQWIVTLPAKLETIFRNSWKFHDKSKLKEFLINDFGHIEWSTQS